MNLKLQWKTVVCCIECDFTLPFTWSLLRMWNMLIWCHVLLLLQCELLPLPSTESLEACLWNSPDRAWQHWQSVQQGYAWPGQQDASEGTVLFVCQSTLMLPPPVTASVLLLLPYCVQLQHFEGSDTFSAYWVIIVVSVISGYGS